MFMKHLIMTMIYAETLINQAVDSLSRHVSENPGF